jgi:transcriptional regulator with GAF, ATPase, and Fis domain
VRMLFCARRLTEHRCSRNIVGTSPALQRVLIAVSKVASADSTILLAGETGTGKELVARAIQKKSSRSARAFVTVNR